MTQSFRTAAKSNVSEAKRREAIDELVRADDTRNLAVLARVNGLSGGLRRRAVDGLIACGADDRLEELASDRSVPSGLREKAKR